MSLVDGARSHWRVFGPRGLQWIALARLARRPMLITVASPGHVQPVSLRMRTTDVSLYEEIVMNAEYGFHVAPEPAVIVDAGANIGMTSVYFANRYPAAKVIAIEPEASNFRLLARNCERYPNIVPLEAALWCADTRVDLRDPGSGHWGFRIDGPGGDDRAAGVRALTVPTLMREFGLSRIDLLKVDIEGAEKEAFAHAGAWIDRVGAVAVELHDRWKPGCTAAVDAATRGFPVRWTRGETTFFQRAPAAGRAPAAAPVRAQPRVIGVRFDDPAEAAR